MKLLQNSRDVIHFLQHCNDLAPSLGQGFIPAEKARAYLCISGERTKALEKHHAAPPCARSLRSFLRKIFRTSNRVLFYRLLHVVQRGGSQSAVRGTSRIGNTQELVRNENPQVPPQTYWIINSGGQSEW